jgi:hypothetical protein
MREYAEAWEEHKKKIQKEMQSREDFNPFTEDPNCKSCKKRKKT